MTVALPDDLRARLSPPPRYDTLDAVVTPAGPVHLGAPDAWPAVARVRGEALVARWGLGVTDVAADAQTSISLHTDVAAAMQAIPSGLLPPEVALPRDNPEAYGLAVYRDGKQTRVHVMAAQPAGVEMAIRSLAQMWSDAGLVCGGILDWPAWPVRGVIEGFYGAPWSPDARAGMLRFLAARKFNTFVYAPKDDLYHRSLWREPYPEDAFGAVLQQIEQCTAEGLRFVYSLAPGLDLQYSAPEDVALICAKYRTLFDAGVRDFGLYFDDIPYVFLNDADVPVYGEATPDDIAPLGVAQAAVTMQVLETLQGWDPACTLIFCPVEYWGDCESGYVRALRDGLAPEVDIFYTGPQICSTRLETAHTARISGRFGRPITFWDNYPVNDASMTGRLHTNPIVGRDADLFTAARGLISNPMPQCEASKLALGTIAEYLWGPDAYEPEAAFYRTALALLDHPAEAAHLQVFAENMRHCCLHETESDALAADVRAVQAAWGGADARAAAKTLLNHLAELRLTATAFERLSNPALRHEMLPWVAALEGWTNVARRALGVLQTPADRRPHERDLLETACTRMNAVQEETCGDIVASFARWVLEQTA